MNTKYYYVVYKANNNYGYRIVLSTGELDIANAMVRIDKDINETCIITYWKEISADQAAQFELYEKVKK